MEIMMKKKEKEMAEEYAQEKSKQEKSHKPNKKHETRQVNFTVMDIYTILTKEMKEDVELSEEEQVKAKDMKLFLKEEFGTEDIKSVNQDLLKKAIKGESLVARIDAKINVGKMLRGKKDIISKGQVFRFEDMLAKHLESSKCNNQFGFEHLHYTVSEAVGSAVIRVIQKTKDHKEVGVRTITDEGTAQPNDDYVPVDQILKFEEKDGGKKEVLIEIMDDENWEPDEDFYIELYNIADGKKLNGDDTKTRVTILDDDKPGFLSFLHQNVKISCAEKQV